MSREKTKPTEIISDSGPHDGEITRIHPAYAMIGANRVSGGHTALFGSPIKHNSTVRIAIAKAKDHYHLHRSWYHAETMPLVEVELSEAQWASFVSTMNIGSGVPCTLLVSRDGSAVLPPEIDDTSFMEKQAADIKKTLADKMTDIFKVTAEFKAMAEIGTPTKTKLKEMASRLDHIIAGMPNHAEFMAESLTDHVDNLVTVAKAEVSAYITRASMQFPALADNAPELPSIEDKSASR